MGERRVRIDYQQQCAAAIAVANVNIFPNREVAAMAVEISKSIN
jgi:hypothetical protein